MRTRRPGLLAMALAGVMLAAGFVSLRHVAERNSPTWDEMHQWGIGYYVWQTGRFDTPGAL